MLAPAEGATLLVLVEPLTLAFAEGAALLVLVVPERNVGRPGVPALIDVFAMQAALLVPVLTVAAGAVEARTEGRAAELLSAPVLAGAEAATLVRGAPLAVLVTGAGAVLVVGAAVPPLPHAASTNEAAASVGRSGLNIMNRFLRVDLAAPGKMSVLMVRIRPLRMARTTRAIPV